jgi:hypothetical protein
MLRIMEPVGYAIDEDMGHNKDGMGWEVLKGRHE